MLTPRFFCPLPLEIGSQSKLPKEISTHAGRSLRLKEGTKISLFDGNNLEFHGPIAFINGDAFFTPEYKFEISRELSIKVGLAQALSTADKMDFVIEKAVELGVSEFYPIIAKRSVLKISPDRLNKKMDHWRKIIISASEQCGRNILMKINEPQSIENFLKSSSGCKCFVAEPDSQNTLISESSTNDIQSSIICIGPEGGWNSTEIDLFSKSNSKFINLGERILRTETAGLMAISAWLALIQSRLQ